MTDDIIRGAITIREIPGLPGWYMIEFDGAFNQRVNNVHPLAAVAELDRHYWLIDRVQTAESTWQYAIGTTKGIVLIGLVSFDVTTDSGRSLLAFVLNLFVATTPHELVRC